jgi:hypothetical protein
MKKINRKDILLKAAYDYLQQCDNSYLVQYDGTDCDGSCLMEDIAIELEIDNN